MALKALLETTSDRTDPAEVTITFKGETLRFRRPRLGDMTPSEEQIRNIGKAAPGIGTEPLVMVHVLAMGYIPDPSEGDASGYQLFGGLAIKNDLIFSELCREWEAAFPEFTGYWVTRINAKNGSRTAGESATAPPTVPSESENFPVSLPG